ncbi:lysophospholipid acyltransferase family protein [Comamonas composti]|uniref:lysophospholipid acyltransferase family protein n=1 Tax=Comamonas composti TaxID=408558 RepID=UPI000400A7C1|nr:lysophospholipid acyltransferase family protein [Comamonas composti]
MEISAKTRKDLLTRKARAVCRSLCLLGHVLKGLWIVLLHFPRLSEQRQQAHVQVWAAQLMAKAGVRLQIQGQVPQGGPALMVSNHISWLDIPVLHAARHCRFISKSDVRGWPLIGRLATAAGTLYIERSSRRDARRMMESMAEALSRREILAVFPEGTTGNGHDLLPFHSNLLQAAVQVDAPVLPVGLRFVEGGTGAISRAPSYEGDENLLGSIWRTLCADDLVAVVHYGQPQQAQGRDRRAWAKDLHAEVDRLRSSPLK